MGLVLIRIKQSAPCYASMLSVTRGMYVVRSPQLACHSRAWTGLPDVCRAGRYVRRATSGGHLQARRRALGRGSADDMAVRLARVVRRAHPGEEARAPPGLAARLRRLHRDRLRVRHRHAVEPPVPPPSPLRTLRLDAGASNSCGTDDHTCATAPLSRLPARSPTLALRSRQSRLAGGGMCVPGVEVSLKCAQFFSKFR